MESDVDALWETILQTRPILMREWINCFRGDEAAARREVSRTLSDEDRWKSRRSNFLLRLVGDDKTTGYRDASGNCKPRVQLALAFVRHTSQDSRFAAFVLATLNACGDADEKFAAADAEREAGENAGAGSPPTDHPDAGIRMTDLGDGGGGGGGGGGSDERRGNGVLHEAAKSGTCGHLERFLSETNVDARNNIGETALHLAAEFEHAKDVAILLRAGATIEVTQPPPTFVQCTSYILAAVLLG